MLDKDTFLKKFKIEKEFEDSGLEWSVLEAIYDDYTLRRSEVARCMKELEQYIRENFKASYHSMRCREKDPEHLVEKIIRKRGKEQVKKYEDIGVSNYREIIRDLIGVRILIFSKEEWSKIYEDVKKNFASSEEEDPLHYIAEPPKAYTRYGDRNVFQGRIYVEHSNKGYRSQHYVVKFKEYYCEIQVRTLAEEVYGEFDHKVKYPYREDNKFLVRYTRTLSQLLGSVDELISTCFQMEADGWDQCSLYYDEDDYIDWRKTSQKTQIQMNETESVQDIQLDRIDARGYSNNIILRKG